MNSVNKTILIIEDDRILLEMFDEFLGRSYAIKAETNITDALKSLKSTAIDAIITDFHLGTHNADTLIEWLIENRPELTSNVIILTGELSIRSKHHNHIASVLYKPVAFDKLQTVVDHMFDHQHPEIGQ